MLFDQIRAGTDTRIPQGYAEHPTASLHLRIVLVIHLHLLRRVANQMTHPPEKAAEGSYLVTFLGDLFADIQTSTLASLPAWGEDRVVDSIQLLPGGSAANTARHFGSLAASASSPILQSYTSPALCCCVGQDVFGNVLHDVLKQEGCVDLDQVHCRGIATKPLSLRSNYPLRVHSIVPQSRVFILRPLFGSQPTICRGAASRLLLNGGGLVAPRAVLQQCDISCVFTKNRLWVAINRQRPISCSLSTDCG